MSPDPVSPDPVSPDPAPTAHAAPPPRALPGTGQAHRHTLVVVVLNKTGVLNRVSSLMRARNFNIESLAVSHTDRPDISRMTITLYGDDVAVEQATKQLYKLIDVLKVQDVTREPVVSHELALIKVRVSERNRAEVIKVIEMHNGRIVDIADTSVIVESSGPEAQIDALVALLGSYGIKEIVRTGSIVMTRGAQSIEEAFRR